MRGWDDYLFQMIVVGSDSITRGKGRVGEVGNNIGGGIGDTGGSHGDSIAVGIVARGVVGLEAVDVGEDR